MDTPNKIPDHDFENGLLLDQTEDDPINNDELDEAILLEIDQTTTNTTNDTNTSQQHANEINLWHDELEWQYNWVLPKRITNTKLITIKMTVAYTNYNSTKPLQSNGKRQWWQWRNLYEHQHRTTRPNWPRQEFGQLGVLLYRFLFKSIFTTSIFKFYINFVWSLWYNIAEIRKISKILTTLYRAARRPYFSLGLFKTLSIFR